MATSSELRRRKGRSEWRPRTLSQWQKAGPASQRQCARKPTPELPSQFGSKAPKVIKEIRLPDQVAADRLSPHVAPEPPRSSAIATFLSPLESDGPSEHGWRQGTISVTPFSTLLTWRRSKTELAFLCPPKKNLSLRGQNRPRFRC